MTFFFAERSTWRLRRLSGKPSAGCKRHILTRINVLSCFRCRCLPGCDLAGEISSPPPHSADRLHFRSTRIPRSPRTALVRYSRWQFDNSQRSLPASPSFPLSCISVVSLHVLVFSLPGRSTATSTAVGSRAQAEGRCGMKCERCCLNMRQRWFLHKLQWLFCASICHLF